MQQAKLATLRSDLNSLKSSEQVTQDEIDALAARLNMVQGDIRAIEKANVEAVLAGGDVVSTDLLTATATALKTAVTTATNRKNELFPQLQTVKREMLNLDAMVKF